MNSNTKEQTIEEAEEEAHKINMAECNGILIERERVLRLVDEWFNKRLINVNWSELKAKIKG